MPSLSLEYIAGLFDGEGHICINFNGKSKSSVKTEVGISNNDKNILFSIKEYFCVGMIYSIKPYNDERKKENFRFKIWKMIEVKVFLEQLLPHLVIKRRQAELCLAFINSRFSKQQRKRPYSDFELRLIEELYKEHWKLRGNRNE